MRPFPDAARIDVPGTLASDLLASARALPARENAAYYDDGLQAEARAGLESRCADGLGWLRDEIKVRLARAPFSVVVGGLEFDTENRLFVGLLRAFGRLVSKPLQKPRAQLVHYLHHDADLASPRTGKAYTEFLHTDGADWPEQVDLVAMVCARPDERGEGRSRVLDMYTLCDEVRERFGSGALDVLRAEPVPWQLAPEFDVDLVWRNVLGQDTMCWRRYTIDFALSRPGVAISPAARHALDVIDTATSSTTSAHQWLLRAGELLLVDNRRCLHGRTAVARHRASQRLMIRSWVRTDTADLDG